LTRLILRRLAQGVLTLFLISLIVFAAVLALPGDAATAILGREATPDRVAALREQLNLNDSVVTQYLDWIGGVLTGNFGESAATQQPVTELLSDRVANTTFLVFVAAVVAVPLSIGIGVWTAVHRDRAVDHVVSTSTLVLAALPEFVIGIGLVLLFATSVFQWFPAVSLLAPGQRAWELPEVVVLPAATLVLAVTPYISRIMRGSMVEVLESEYVTMARLKGMSERTVIWRHAVPNAIVPAIQVAALQLAWMAGGVVVVEFVFSYPGIGAALVDAVGNRDMPVVQTVTMLAAGVYVLMNLVADLATILVTPKLRTAAR
jgi:peptide/nickel transport system permease protein